MERFQVIILSILLSKEQKQFISSALYTAEQSYRNKFNNPKNKSYRSPVLENNIPKLVKIREMFDRLI